MIISIVNHKGGTGKTTTTINLGSALSTMGKRVLLIDFDAQGSLTYSLGLDEGPAISDVLLGDCTIEQVIQRREGMDVMPANTDLADVEFALAKSEERFLHLRQLLKLTSGYDFVLIDCPPSLSLLTLNALAASEFLLIPMQMDVLALWGLDAILETVKKVRAFHSSLAVLGILPVMVDTRKNIHEEILNHIKSNYAERVFAQSIRSNVRAAEAPSFGKSVVQYAPASSTAHDYQGLSKEILVLKETFHQQLKITH